MEKIWLKHYQAGIAREIAPNTFRSIVEIFEQSTAKFRHRPAMANMNKVLSYGDLDRLSSEFASYLQHTLQLKKGAQVAVMLPNLLQYPVCVFGILRAGLTVVNVNPLYTSRELEYQLNDAGAKTIIILENFANVLAHSLPRTPIKHIIITSIGDLLGFPHRIIVNFIVRNVKKMVPPWKLPHHIRFNDTLALGRNIPFKPVLIDADDIAFLQYTGGTTGTSKGAILLHRNIVANMLQASEWIKYVVREGEEVIATALPLYHIFSLTANLMVFTQLGALNVLITNPRDISGFIKELKKYKITSMTAVNTLFNALLNHPHFLTVDFSTWRMVLGGGAAIQKTVAEKWKAVTKVPLIEAYGLTETSPAACINPMNLTEYNGTIGVPIPSTDIQIRDSEGQEVPLGQTGELCIRGPQVMKGYWNRPEETAQTLGPDGFLATGDIATITPEGFVKLVDRKKDMILVSGFNVYPNEIEDIIAGHPGVLEVACIGVPDEKSGETVKVFVVKKDPAVTDQDIINRCRHNLTSYKIPKHIEFRRELPKTNVGKILRRLLREEEIAKHTSVLAKT